MKVYINKYKHHWLSPYTMLDYAFYWTDWSKCSRWSIEQSLEDEARAQRGEKTQYVERPEWCESWADRLTPISQAIQWVLDRVDRKIDYVKIDRWDTWSMDHTLGMIVLPMLKQLQATKHGAPATDDEDVPEYLRSTMAQPKEYEWDTDDLHFKRWDWIIGEMIFAFECKNDDSWQDAFRSGTHDIKWIPVDKDGNEVAKGEHRYYQMGKGPNDTYQCDYEGMQRVQDRITNGFRLFGKYYEALWD